MKRVISILILVVLATTLLAACSVNPEEAIIGTWRCTDDSQPHIYLCGLTFFENGRFVDKDGHEGYFVIDGDILHLDFDFIGRESINFTIARHLTLKFGNELRIVLVRQ